MRQLTRMTLPPNSRSPSPSPATAAAAVLKNDWDGFFSSRNRIARADTEPGPPPLPSSAHKLSLLTRRWGAAWAAATPSAAPPSSAPPSPPAALADAAVTALRSRLDDAERSGVPSEALRAIASDLSNAMWNADPASLRHAHDAISHLLGARRAEPFTIGPGKDDFLSTPAVMLSAPLMEERIRRDDLLFLEGLQAVNERIRELTPAGRHPPDVDGPGTRGQLCRLIEESLRAVVTDSSFSLDADLVVSLAASAAPRDRARFEALWKVFPELQRLGGHGALLTPRFFSKQADEAIPVNIDDVMAALPAGDTAGAAQIATPVPWPIVAQIHPRRQQQLDRSAGILTLDNTSRAGHHRLTVQFQPCAPGADETARRRQDDDLRVLEDFLIAHFGDAWPERLHLNGDRIEVGRLAVAERSAAGWCPRYTAIREVVGHFSHRAPSDRPELSQWPSRHQLPKGNTSADPMARVHVVLQVEGDDNMHAISEWLVGKDPHRTLWIQADPGLDSRILHGADLVRRITPQTEVKLTIAGHGGRACGHFTVGQRMAGPLAEGAKEVLREHGIDTRVNRIVLNSCGTESSASDQSFVRPFIKRAQRIGLTTGAGTVTAYRHLVHVSPDGTRRTTPYVGGLLSRHAPDTTLIFNRNPKTGDIGMRDKYPSAGPPLAEAPGQANRPPIPAEGPVNDTTVDGWSLWPQRSPFS